MSRRRRRGDEPPPDEARPPDGPRPPDEAAGETDPDHRFAADDAAADDPAGAREARTPGMGS